MKKFLIIAGIVAAFATSLFIPAKQEQITIIKSQIHENRPFAGIINDRYVGGDICCQYWIDPYSRPDTAYYMADLSWIGSTIAIREITGAH